jgi:hypothetical protein
MVAGMTGTSVVMTPDALRWAASVATSFWASAAEQSSYPRSPQDVAVWSLPLGFVSVRGLTLGHVRRFLHTTLLPMGFGDARRPLHACLVAYAGRGVVFLRADDPPDERRFSAAHEIGHFLTDYLEPRRRAIERLGEEITGVLDGRRPPTPTERVDAVLVGVSPGGYTHMLPLVGDAVGGLSLEVESRADLLALALLAPADEVRRRVLRASRGSRSDLAVTASRLLRGEFGLPAGPARFYARLLFGGRWPSVRRWLGLEVRHRVALRCLLPELNDGEGW